jgi:hypothetical protein
MATQIMGSRVVFSSIELVGLVSYLLESKVLGDSWSANATIKVESAMHL